ncbi:phospholipase A2-like [Tubulanus polymorphus]|uniref:phospholipase A2-like n=1 Tax=Tubulanus polymorphus TaxID=672921 RepID=UPI003DA44B70
MTWLISAILALFCLSAVNVDCARIGKRLLTQFDDMLVKYLGMSGKDFDGYGNYCGVGGSGEPVDEIDKCCMHHDHCYISLGKSDECKAILNVPKAPYFIHYNNDVTKDSIRCLDDPNEEPCRSAICTCDRTVTLCFNKHRNIYNKDNLSDSFSAKIQHEFIKIWEKIKRKIDKWI